MSKSGNDLPPRRSATEKFLLSKNRIVKIQRSLPGKYSELKLSKNRF
jgi:hypothetical protein